MNGEIAQIIALTCHGNATLRGMKIPEFFPSNSTCQFCDKVTFVEIAKRFIGGQRKRPVADSPDQWFRYLVETGATGVRLSQSPQSEDSMPDRVLAGFAGGGGVWTMDALYPSGKAVLWIANWDVWNQNASNNKIWRVTYRRVAEKEISSFSEPDLSKVSERLLAALTKIRAFSDDHHCGGFTQCFDEGIESLTTSKRSGYHKDLAPDNSIPPIAVAILDACQSAWVFGGMGSWNDMGFDGDDELEYERVSEQLFDAIADSISTAATSSFCVAGK
jgi:hypothetical protein